MRGLSLGRPFGIPAQLHWSWLFIFALITWSLGAGLFPAALPELGRAAHLWLGALTAALFFGCILAHELGHALAARRLGTPTRRIVLFFFGGVAELDGQLRRGRDEVVVALAGPLVSLVIAGLCWLVSLAGGALGEVGLWLARINALLALFNLLPGFPLDGGRVLRGALWARGGDLPRATQTAAMVGVLVGWGLIGYGVFEVLRGDVLGGIWMVVLAFFLQGAAAAESAGTRAAASLGSLPQAGTLALADWPTVGRDTRLSRVADLVLETGRRAFPVVEEERFFGLITLDNLRSVERSRWAWLPASEAMLSQVHSLAPGDSALSALEQLARHRVQQMPVLDGERYLGMVSRDQLLALIQLNTETPLLTAARRGA